MSRKLSDEQVVNIYNALKSGESAKSLAYKYDVHPTTIKTVKRAEHKVIAEKTPIVGRDARFQTNQKVIEMYTKALNGKTTWDIAKEHNVSTQLVNFIKAKKYHKDILKDLPPIPKKKVVSKISDELALEVFKELQNKTPLKDIMQMFGVSNTTVNRIRRKVICTKALSVFDDIKLRGDRLKNVNQDSIAEMNFLLSLGVRKTIIAKKYDVSIQFINKISNVKEEILVIEDFTKSYDNYKAVSDLLNLGVPPAKIAKRFNISQMKLSRFINKECVEFSKQ